MSEPEVPLPELSEGWLDPESLGQLVLDIEGLTQVLEVIVKGAPERFASDQRVALRQAFAMISTRTIQGMQVRYRWEGETYMDTLLWTPQGLKVVRMKGEDRPVGIEEVG